MTRDAELHRDFHEYRRRELYNGRCPSSFLEWLDDEPLRRLEFDVARFKRRFRKSIASLEALRDELEKMRSAFTNSAIPISALVNNDDFDDFYPIPQPEVEGNPFSRDAPLIPDFPALAPERKKIWFPEGNEDGKV